MLRAGGRNAGRSTAAGCGERRERLNVYFRNRGSAASALARYFLHEGQRVAGYDRVRSHLTDQIEAEGAVVHYEEDPALIPADFGIRHDDRGSIRRLFRRIIPSCAGSGRAWFRDRRCPQMRGYLSQGKFVMAVAGTHGKTTTTTLVAWLNHRVTGGGKRFPGWYFAEFSSNLVLGRGAASGGRGRRVRPFVPAAVARRGGGHLGRCRSSGYLRYARGIARGFLAVRRTDPRRRGAGRQAGVDLKIGEPRYPGLPLFVRRAVRF